jgi:hypothetical protein
MYHGMVDKKITSYLARTHEQPTHPPIHGECVSGAPNNSTQSMESSGKANHQPKPTSYFFVFLLPLPPQPHPLFLVSPTTPIPLCKSLFFCPDFPPLSFLHPRQGQED